MVLYFYETKVNPKINYQHDEPHYQNLSWQQLPPNKYYTIDDNYNIITLYLTIDISTTGLACAPAGG